MSVDSSTAITDTLMRDAADKAAILALKYPANPTSADVLRFLTLAYLAGAEKAMDMAHQVVRL